MKNSYLNHIICTIIFSLISLIFVTSYTYSEGTGKIQGEVVKLGNKGVSDAIVFLENLIGDYEPPDEHAVIDQINTEFVPHVLPILKGTTVDFFNSDSGWHNVNSHLDESVTRFNLGTFPPGQSRAMKFNEEGVVPIECSMHSGMIAYVIVLNNPYFSVSGKKGSFVIENVPIGEHNLAVWHEKKRADKQMVNVESGKTTVVNFKLK